MKAFLLILLCTLQREGARKWIIDLRLNAGGPMLPMIAGLSPLLGNGAFLGYADVRGEVMNMTRLKNGKFSSPDGGMAEVVVADGGIRETGASHSNEQASAGEGEGKSALEQTSVVILTGHGTGRAGECVAVAFKGRPHTWFIGEPTASFATKGYTLAGEKMENVMAVSVLVDRRHRVYPRNLIPDEWVPGGEDFSDYGQDRKIQAAVRRLEKN